MWTGNEIPLDRRGFLAAGLVVGLQGVDKLALAAGPAKPYGDFIVGAQSYCFRKFNTEQALKRTSDLGLHYIEFYQAHAPLDSSKDQIKSLLRMCSDYGITPISYGVQRFTKDHEANKKIFDFGQAIGVKHFSADPEPDSFDSLDKLCETHRISVAIHPHGPAGRGKLHRWYGSEVILPAVRNHHPLIGTCLDTGHLIRSEQLGKKLDPAEEVRAMGPRNFGLHLKDHDNKRKTDVVYGKGALDVPAVLRALQAVNFKGYISIEYEANPDNPSTDMKACLDILKSAVKNL